MMNARPERAQAFGADSRVICPDQAMFGAGCPLGEFAIGAPAGLSRRRWNQLRQSAVSNKVFPGSIVSDALSLVQYFSEAGELRVGQEAFPPALGIHRDGQAQIAAVRSHAPPLARASMYDSVFDHHVRHRGGSHGRSCSSTMCLRHGAYTSACFRHQGMWAKRCPAADRHGRRTDLCPAARRGRSDRARSTSPGWHGEDGALCSHQRPPTSFQTESQGLRVECPLGHAGSLIRLPAWPWRRTASTRSHCQNESQWRFGVNVDRFIETIRRSGQHCHLYHFTDRENIPSICERGLFSKERMRAEGWWPAAPGGNQLSHELDIRYGINPYVSLCFTQNHPMLFRARQEGRLLDSRYLKICPEVLRIAGTLISFGVANAADAQHLPVAEAVGQFDERDIEVIYSRTDWLDPEVNQRLQAAEKFEILIPHHVPIALIVGGLNG